MCGIAGYWSSTHDSRRAAALDAGLVLMKHRGPDDHGMEIDRTFGELGLGHARLSIIDLSSGGHQPMHSADDRYSMVFNGEIYNYRELKAELAAVGTTFRTRSDSEVLLAAWAHWGEACLPRLIGMFAFAIVDRTAGTLSIVRDAFGIKPMFYATPDWGLCFASELPAACRLRDEAASLNLQSSYNYLVHGDYDSTPATFVAGMFQLEPGVIRVLDLRTGVLGAARSWWTPNVAEAQPLRLDDAADRLRHMFLESINLHLRSDVPLGSALSGGVDSSAVVCAMRHLQPDADIHTFSFVAKGSRVSEESWVDLVNSHVGAIPHKVYVEPDELAADLDDMIRAQGEPFGGTSIYAQYRVFQEARRAGITVTLDGQGADELLAGYHGYPGKRLRSMIDRGRIGEAVSFLRSWAKWPGRSVSYGLKNLVAEYAQGEVYQRLRGWAGTEMRPDWLDTDFLAASGVQLKHPRIVSNGPSGRRLAAELALSSTRRGLPALLRHADRNSMRFSVESRVPFLTSDLADFLFALPEQYLISSQGETKHVFRAAMRGIVPDAILDRRDKIGFATPEEQWLKQLGPQVRRWLEDDAEGLPFLNRQAMLDAYDQMLSGVRRFSWQAWRWLNFCRWHRTVFLPLTQL
jgi:asparagine synthase (glutamine-hydrolysing)